MMAILFSGNMWFGARMVSRFDKMEESFWMLSQKVVVLEARLENTCKQGGYREAK